MFQAKTPTGLPYNICSQTARAITAAASKASDKMPRLGGYIAVYNSLSEPIWDSFKWELAPGSFDRTLREKANQRMLFDHNWASVLGNREEKTAEFYTDDQGLLGFCDPPPVEWARALCIQVERGDIKAASFGFDIFSSHWRQADGWDIEVITDVDLWEGTICTLPRFSKTDGLIQVLASAGIPREHVNKVFRGINRAQNNLEMDQDDVQYLNEYRSLYEPRFAADLMQQIDSRGSKKASLVVPVETWQAHIDVLKLKG